MVFFPHLLPVRVLNGWVVLLHEYPLHELDGERGLAHSAGAQDDDLVLAHPGVQGAGRAGGRVALERNGNEIQILNKDFNKYEGNRIVLSKNSNCLWEQLQFEYFSNERRAKRWKKEICKV